MDPIADILREIVRETRGCDAPNDRRIQALAVRALGILADAPAPDAAAEQLRAALTAVETSLRWWARKVVSEEEAEVHRQHADQIRAALAAPIPGGAGEDGR